MEASTSLERQRARAIAEEYRSRGYEVIEEPSPEQLPEFLSGYRPDLLVRKGDEVIVSFSPPMIACSASQHTTQHK